MRLRSSEIDTIKKRLYELSSDAKLYIFGSRVDDTKRGGDIDLLIVSDKLSKKDIRLIRVDFCNHFGDQKLDIVLDNGDLSDPFVKHIYKKAILL